MSGVWVASRRCSDFGLAVTTELLSEGQSPPSGDSGQAPQD